MDYITYTYTLPYYFPIENIFNTSKLGLKNKVYKKILEPSIKYYCNKYKNDNNILKLTESHTCDIYNFTIDVICRKYLFIEIYKYDYYSNYMMDITIETELNDRELISDLLYFYTHKYSHHTHTQQLPLRLSISSGLPSLSSLGCTRKSCHCVAYPDAADRDLVHTP